MQTYYFSIKNIQDNVKVGENLELKTRFRQKSHIPMLIRAEMMIKKFPEFIKDKSVLEIGPADGWMSEAMLMCGAKHLDLVEKNPDSIKNLSIYFENEINENKVKIINDDANYYLPTVSPGSYKTIVCAGFLYHSCHTFWILENMARINPDHILIDTMLINPGASEFPLNFQLVDYFEGHNQAGLKQSIAKAPPYSLAFKKEVFLNSMDYLGYSLDEEIEKPDSLKLYEQYMHPQDQGYFKKWRRRSFTAWFKRKA